MKLLHEIRFLVEVTIVETIDVIKYFTEGTINLLRRLFAAAVRAGSSFFDDPFRVMMLVWTIVFILMMTR